MATLLDLKARIKVVGNIKKVTRAMQLVAAAKFTRAQNRARAARPYTNELDKILGTLSGVVAEARDASDTDGTPVVLSFLDGVPPIETYREKLFAQKESHSPGLVLITSDRGLCGSFNTRLIKAAQDFLADNEGKDCKLLLIGRKGFQFFKSRKVPIIYRHEGVGDKLNLNEVKTITAKLVELFVNGDVDSLHLLYTQFKSAMSSKVTLEQFLSIPPVAGEKSDELYILEPDTDSLFATLLPFYATTKVVSALADSFASEYGARMTAMQSATKNAEEMLQNLIILRNRLRQAIITKELAEIVGGAEALK
ncbi:MAG: ATP synthase F1 subunit gamma [Chitinivibrionia bacterium]|nr:ATP synthase F1 subunit gamma [Chitinivibrionia bacterium]